MFRSATVKLTLWYIALVMAISLIFSSILYGVGTGTLSHGLDIQTQRITRQFPVFQNDPLLHPGEELREGDHRLLLRLILFNALVLIAAGFASYWLARRTLEPIEEAHEQQKRFTADVSHELRTPLTAIRMETEVGLLNPDASNNDLREVLHSNLEEVASLELLINSLLKLTRLEADTLQQSFQPVSLITVLSEVRETMLPLADKRSITIASLDMQDTTNDQIVGDIDSIRQLCIILLDNAIKYSPNNSTIELAVSSDAITTEFQITDHGAGIDPVALNHIFDRFYRSDSARTNASQEGYGLGLSIAKMIADVHGARITITSQLTKGTTARAQFAAVSPATKRSRVGFRKT